MITNATIQSKRLWGLDLMKMIASFMVTFYHFQCISYDFVPGAFYLPNINRLLMNLCVVSVPLFFMCNGAILLTKSYQIRQIGRKILKIALLILLWHWLPFPDWFFRTLLGLYVCYPLLKWMMDKKRWMLYCLLGCILIVPFGLNLLTTLLKLIPGTIEIAVGPVSVNLTEMSNTGVFTIYSAVYFVLGGLLIHKRLPKATSIVLTILGFGLTTLEGIIYTNHSGAVYDNVNSSFPTVGALCMSVGIFDLLLRWQPQNVDSKAASIVSFWSKNVLGIYLFHLVLILQIRPHLTEAPYPCVIILLICLVIDVICLAICWLIRKIPYIREVVTI